jgi:hypothetical protein
MVETVPFLNYLHTIGVLATLIFVLTSRLWMGFSLTVPKILPRCIMKVCNSLAGGKLYTLPFASNRLLMVFALSIGLSRGFFFFN